MGRPAAPVRNALGAAIRARRAGQRQVDASQLAGVDRTTLSGIERGKHRPSYESAVALARWLGWTVEQVMEAAAAPVELAE